MEKNDAQIIEEILAGDQRQFACIADRYLKPLYGFVFRLVGDGAVAEDICQDVFIRVWKNMAAFDAKKKFSTWIFAIAKNAAFDYLKKKKSTPFAFFDDESGTNILEYIEDENVLDSIVILEKIDNEKALNEFLQELSPKSRSILLLYHGQGFSLAEVAEIFGSSQNTVKSIYRRSILALREKFASQKEVLGLR